MNTNKKEIQKRIGTLTHQKYEIEQELLSLQKQYDKFLKSDYKQYIGECYKQYIEDIDGNSETVYYRILDIYDEKDGYNYFWVLVVEDHDDNSDITASYIRKERIDLLGHDKFFLRQLTPISEEEFTKALNDITDTIKQISKNIKKDKDMKVTINDIDKEKIIEALKCCEENIIEMNCYPNCPLYEDCNDCYCQAIQSAIDFIKQNIGENF